MRLTGQWPLRQFADLHDCDRRANKKGSLAGM